MCAEPDVKNDPERRSEPVGTSRRTLLMTFRSGAAIAAASLLFQLMMLPIILGALGSGLYGAWAALLAIVAVGSLTDVGVKLEISRRVAAAHGRGDQAAAIQAVHEGTTIVVWVALLVSGAGLIGTPLLTPLILPDGVPGLSESEIHWLLRILLIAMALNVTLGAYFGSLKGLQRNDIESLALLVSLPVNATVTGLGLWWGLGVWSLLWAFVLGNASAHLVQWISLRRIMPSLTFRLRWLSRRDAAAYVTMSGLALLSQVSDVVDSQWDKLVLARYVGVEAVTVFHVGTTLVRQAKLLTLLPLTPLLVLIAELRTTEPLRATELQRVLMKTCAIVTAVIMGGLFVFLPSFTELWLGSDYRTAGEVGRVFVVAVVITMLSAPAALQAFAEGRHRLAAASAAANMAVNAVLSLVLTIHVGLYGAVYGSIGGSIAGTTLLLMLMRRRSERWVPPPLAALVATAGAVSMILFMGFDDFDSWLTFFPAAGAFTVAVVVVGTRLEGLSLRSLLSSTRWWTFRSA